MSRILSELLEAEEPLFSRGLHQLERLAGHPGADIRLSEELRRSLSAALQDLGLDSQDTNGPELYASLGERLKADEERFARALHRAAPDSDDPSAQVAAYLGRNIRQKTCYAIRPAAARRLLRADVPRQTMKLLGYRSADSMLKHESVPALYAAASLIESPAWNRRLVTRYGKLKASDFESREIVIEYPVSARWQTLAESTAFDRRRSVLSFKELGAVVLMPLPISGRPPLSALTTAALTLHAVNEIRAAGTFLKLHQMEAGFGAIVQGVIAHEPLLPADSLDQPAPWHSLHQYFARFRDSALRDIFQPVVAAEELAWDGVEHTLAAIEPGLEFWQQTPHVALMHGGRPVSCNLTDALLSHANGLPFEQRLSGHFKQALRSELLLRYLSHDKLEQLVVGDLSNRVNLVPDMTAA